MWLSSVILTTLTLFNGLSFAFPVALPTTPNPNLIFKRVDAGTVPTIQDFQQQLSAVPKDGCVFYSNGWMDQAIAWAAANGKKTIFDADPAGWAGKKAEYTVTVNGIPQADYNPDSPMSSSKQSAPGGQYSAAQKQEYFENVSSAFTQGCSGDAYLLLEYNTVFLGPASDNIFARVEFPILVKGLATRILVVETSSGGSVVKGPWEWWPQDCERQPLS
jgi:hypothetical protein